MLPLAAGVVAALPALDVGGLPAAAVCVLSESLVPLPHAASTIVLNAASSAAHHRSFPPLSWLIFKYVTLLWVPWPSGFAFREDFNDLDCRSRSLTDG